jgi:pimeloyl-ACP methyl ester carboxylesterase
MRAASPVRDGHVRSGGVDVFFEVYGDGDPTVFLLMPDSIVQSRAWKAQIPFLARSHRVVVSDPPGNGRSGTPLTVDAMAERVLIDQEWAVLDAVGAQRAVLAGVCTGAGHALLMAAEAPGRVLGVCAINPGLRLTTPLPHRIAHDFDAPRESYDDWQKQNRHHWLADWRDFATFFFAEMFPEPHSTKQREDCVAWAMDVGPETMLLEYASARGVAGDPDAAAAACREVRCPVLVITGSDDRCQHPGRGAAVAELTGGDHVVIEGGGHLPQARDPVKVNLLLRDFLRRLTA